MKRRIAMLLMLAMVAVIGTGCTQKKPGDHSASALEVAKAVIQGDATLPELVSDTSEDENAKANFSALSNVDYRRIVAYSRNYAKDGTASEVVIICVESEGDVTAVMNSLKNYVKNRKGTMQEYMPQEVPMLEDSILCSKGCYVGLFIGEKSGLNKQTFLEELASHGIQ